MRKVLVLLSFALTACAWNPDDSRTLGIYIEPVPGAVSKKLPIREASFTKFFDFRGFGQPNFEYESNFATASPTSLSDFDCFVVNVEGKGIPVFSTDNITPIEKLLDGDYCANGGATSQFVSASTGGTLEVIVPAGSQRLVQVLGIQSKIGCPAETLGDFYNRVGDGNFDNYFSGVYEIGRTITDTFSDKEIVIQNSFDSSNLKDLDNNCGNGSNSGELAIFHGSKRENISQFPSDYGTGGTDLTGTEIQTLNDGNNVTTYVTSNAITTSYYAIMDLAYDFRNTNYQNYSSLKYEVRGFGSDICSPLPSGANYGIEIDAFDDDAGTFTGTWKQNGTSSTAPGDFLQQLFNSTYGGLPSVFTRPLTINGVNTDFFHVQINGKYGAGGSCIAIYSARAFLGNQ